MNASMGAAPWVAHTEVAYARLLLLREERERAGRLLASAQASYRRLGMEADLARAAALARTAAPA